MKQTYLFSSVLFALGASFAGVGCQDSFTDCKNTATCPPEGDGDGDSSTGGVGGDGDGDGDGDTGGGGGSGGVGTGGMGTGGDGTGGGMGGDPNNPCLLCEDDEHCTLDGECVECLISDHCDGDDETPVCDTDAGSCVECVAATDCEDPAFPTCEGNSCVAGCEVPEDCARFGELDLCESGACVECLTRDDCPGTVCERATNTCIDNRDAGDVGVCEECEYDDDCAEGQLCVEQTFGGEVVGNFCTWTRDARVGDSGDCFVGGKPFAGQTGGPVTSVEGQAAVLCTLRATSCPAFLQHSQTVPGCEVAEDDDDACGASGLDDGLCRETTGGTPLCTYPCVSDADCRTGSTCPPGDGSYCSL